MEVGGSDEDGNKERSEILSLSPASLSVLPLGSVVEHLVTLEVVLLVKAKMSGSGKVGVAGKEKAGGRGST